MDTLNCFLSYSWDSPDHKLWVLRLAEELQINGVYVHLDQWDVRYGMDLPKYMETKVRECHHVLLICTPNFAKKANSGQGGVGYEKSIITGEIFAGAPRETKFIPVLRAGEPVDAIPSYLKSRMFVNMRDDSQFRERVEELLRHLHDVPTNSRPPLGKRPSFKEPSQSQPRKFDIQKFKQLRDYAYFANGLNLSETAAAKWAEARMKDSDSFDLEKFKKLRAYAYFADGLNLSETASVTWAEKHMKDDPSFDLEEFKRLRDYAYSTDGLNLSESAAVAWADAQLTAK